MPLEVWQTISVRNQKIQLALEGVRASIRALDDEDRVGVIAFAAKIKMDEPPTTVHEEILREVGKLRPGSGTKMYPALEKAYDDFKRLMRNRNISCSCQTASRKVILFRCETDYSG